VGSKKGSPSNEREGAFRPEKANTYSSSLITGETQGPYGQRYIMRCNKNYNPKSIVFINGANGSWGWNRKEGKSNAKQATIDQG